MRSLHDGTNRLFALAKIAVNQAKDGALSVQNDLTKDVIGRESVKEATDKVKDVAKDTLVKSQTTEVGGRSSMEQSKSAADIWRAT
jgi:hypothetical protein